MEEWTKDEEEGNQELRKDVEIGVDARLMM